MFWSESRRTGVDPVQRGTSRRDHESRGILRQNDSRGQTGSSKQTSRRRHSKHVHLVTAARAANLMGTYLARRLLAMVPTMVLASLIVFITIRLIPGDVIDLML